MVPALHEPELRQALERDRRTVVTLDEIAAHVGRPAAYEAGLVRRFAQSDATVVLLGETGSGKERIARAVHALGSRSARRFGAWASRKSARWM